MRNTLLALTIVAVFVAALVLVAVFTRVAAYFSLITLGLALALQKHVASFFGFFIITFSRIFSLGDRIRIGNIKGDVRKIGLFHFVLDEVGEDEKLGGELTGRILNIPNLIVLDQTVLNYSKDYSVNNRLIKSNLIFDEVRIPVTPQSDLPKAQKLLEDIITEEDRPYVSQAKEGFGPDYPNFVKEAEEGPRIIIHLDSQKVWLKGKFVTPYQRRNELKTRIYLKFIENLAQDSSIKLA